MEKQATKHRGDLIAEDSRNYNAHVLNIAFIARNWKFRVP